MHAMPVILIPESHRESEVRDSPGEMDKKYFMNRHKKRRETLATITDTVRNNTEVVPEESKLKGNVKAGHHRPVSETPFEWRFACGPMVTRYMYCMLAGRILLTAPWSYYFFFSAQTSR